MRIHNKTQNYQTASNSLFGYLPKPASIANESIPCSGGTPKTLCYIKLVNKTKINTVPGGIKSVIQDAPDVEADDTPMSETSYHPVHVALLQIEKVIDRKHLNINRLMEGCYASFDGLYNTLQWLEVY